VNLFHSFGDFNVPTNNIANFLNDSGLATSNILGRVTGGNPSTIFGTIQTTGFGNANLFLMNPTGFLFGPNATVNVGGMVAFTSADYLKLTDNVRFNAIPNAAADALLSTAPVAAYGFLGSNPGAITVQGSLLSVTPGQSISLIGGNITVQSGVLDDGTTVQSARLSAPGGQINIASVSSPGEVSAVEFTPVAGMTMGGINLSQGATLDVSGNAAGTVRIRGGQLVIADATISADTVNINGTPTAVDIQITGDMSISDTRGFPAITARSVGDGDAGAVQINSANLVATSTSPASTPFALIDTDASGAGAAGNINIATGNLQASYQGPGMVQFIDSGTAAGPAHGGNVRISAQSVTLEGTGINAGPSLALSKGLDPTGSSGNVIINADRLMLLNSIIDTSVFGGGPFPEPAGSITFNARDINLTQSVVT
jgi:filamentous hemagglutinin family protein